jgi:hypothetical protein
MDIQAAMDGLRGQDANALHAQLKKGPLIRVDSYSSGRPSSATCLMAIPAPAGSVWTRIRGLDALPALIEMVESLTSLPPGPQGEELVHVKLRFKITIFTARFDFVARIERQDEHRLELIYHSGKVHDLRICFELAPVSADSSVLLCRVGFDPRSLGWLANIFIRHHPEIEWGIHAGSALSVAQAARTLAQGRDRPK